MTVHTAVFLQIVVGENFLLPILYAALLNLYLVPYFVIGFYQSVGEISIQTVAHYLPGEGFERRPFSLIAL